MILWMLEDSDSGKDEILLKERERIPLALAKEREQKKMVRNHQDEQTHRKFKVSVGLAGKHVTNTRTAWQDHSSRVKDSQINSLGKGSDAKGKSGKCGGKKGKSKDAGALVESTTEPGCELGGIVHTADGNKHNGWHG